LSKLILIISVIAIPASALAQADLSPIKEYFITCDPDSFKYIYDNPFKDHYIPVTFAHQNKTYLNVRLRIRGDSSRELPKKSFKIKFDGENFSNGRKELNFNADYLDKSYLHSILASRLMRESGHPCFEAEPARLYINGKFRGLYIRIENMDEDFLVTNGFNPEGNLYKAARDGACLSIFDDVYYHWEKKTNKKSDRDDLEDFIQTLNAVPDYDYLNFASVNFDYKKMVNLIALNMLIANGSTYYHNYYLYHDIHISNKWIIFPWDLDLSFNLYGLNYPYHRSSGYGVPDNPFLERAILCKPIFKDIKNRIYELSNTIFNANYLFPIIDSLKSILAFSVEQDSSDDVPNTTAWEKVIAEDRNFINNRDTYLQNQFNHYPTSFRIERVIDIFTDSVSLNWHPSTDPDGDRISYTLKYSDRKYFIDSYTITFRGITDTLFTLPRLPAEGEYFWLVSATDGGNVTDGFDSWNKFVVHSDFSDLVVINEINYNSSNDFDPEDWVELHNPHNFEIDLSGWIFKDGNDAHLFTLPEKTEIISHGYLVLCRNLLKFQDLFPGVTNITGDFDFGLGGDGELIRLFDKSANLVDSLTYDDSPPWSTEPDGNGPTLELINPSIDNAIAANWAASANYGTPGKRNAVFAKTTNETSHKMAFIPGQNYPNPFNYATNINFEIPEPGEVELKIYNINGQLVTTIKHNPHGSGPVSIRWIAGDQGSGIYFYQIKFNNKYSSLKKAILLK